MSGNFFEVMRLGRHSDVVLLRDTSSGKLVVRRIVDGEQAEIYRTLKNNKIPHIPEIYSITETENGTCEILEEYIEGLTLEEILNENGLLSEESAVLYITELCEMLAPLHRKGLVHRDIKPSNVVITAGNDAYLIDFDIARIQKEKSGTDTRVLGTQGYAAPEQYGFQQTSAQTDIYALGVLLNKMLTGKLPQEQIAKGPLSYIIRRCIQMDVDKRYRNVASLERALRPYLSPEHSKAYSILRQIPGFRSFTRWELAVAGVIYAFIILCIAVEVPEIIQYHAGIYTILSMSFYVFLLFFLFDSFQIRSRIKWLEKSRGQFRYPLKCVFLVIMVLIVLAMITTIANGILK
jgi:serine/threonine protein kinase